MLSCHKTNAKKQARIMVVEKIGVRKEIDKLGRICIPKDMRRLFNLENEIELQVTKDGILIKNPEYVLVRRSEK